jgi:glycerophosphoryl diester phosphodiesterase
MGSPPNGREHLRRAMASGADSVELDIRLSADGVVLLSHDDFAPGPDGTRAALRSLSREALRSLGGPEPVLDLEEALELLGGSSLNLNLDAKEPEAALAAAECLSALGMADRAIFSGLEPEAAESLRAALGGFARLLNADPLLPASGYGLDSIREASRIARECGCCGLNLDFRAATEELMAFAYARCLPVFLWTVDEPEDMETALGLEPYSLTSNWPDRLICLINGGKP